MSGLLMAAGDLINSSPTGAQATQFTNDLGVGNLFADFLRLMMLVVLVFLIMHVFRDFKDGRHGPMIVKLVFGIVVIALLGDPNLVVSIANGLSDAFKAAV